MDQVKIGQFLKKLRSERGVTQEQAAEQLCVSARTISRWETGRNMPDIGTLVELAEYFDVSISEIINGERKSENMNQEEKETLLKVADYSDNERSMLMKRVLIVSILGLAALLLALMSMVLEWGAENPLFQFMEGVCSGLAAGALLTCILFAAGVLARIKSNVRLRKAARILGVVCIAFVVFCLMGCMLTSMLK